MKNNNMTIMMIPEEDEVFMVNIATRNNKRKEAETGSHVRTHYRLLCHPIVYQIPR